MGEPKTLHFYDVGIFEPVTKPQNQVFFSLETPQENHRKATRKSWGNQWKIIIIHYARSQKTVRSLKQIPLEPQGLRHPPQADDGMPEGHEFREGVCRHQAPKPTITIFGDTIGKSDRTPAHRTPSTFRLPPLLQTEVVP